MNVDIAAPFDRLITRPQLLAALLSMTPERGDVIPYWAYRLSAARPTNVDAQTNSCALPILDQEVVQKQSAAIDTISGATVTSDGYLQSLQSAIDQAHL